MSAQTYYKFPKCLEVEDNIFPDIRHFSEVLTDWAVVHI